MGANTAKAAEAQGIEYSVYVYNDPHKSQGKTPWEMKTVTDNMDKAMSAAHQLHESRQYTKIEVKKKYFDQKNNRTVDMTLKVLEGNLKREISILTILFSCIALSAAAFAAAYFLTAQ